MAQWGGGGYATGAPPYAGTGYDGGYATPPAPAPQPGGYAPPPTGYAPAGGYAPPPPGGTGYSTAPVSGPSPNPRTYRPRVFPIGSGVHVAGGRLVPVAGRRGGVASEAPAFALRFVDSNGCLIMGFLPETLSAGARPQVQFDPSRPPPLACGYFWITPMGTPPDTDMVSWDLWVTSDPTAAATQGDSPAWQLVDSQRGYPVPAERGASVATSLPLAPHGAAVEGVRWAVYFETPRATYDCGYATFFVELKGVDETFGPEWCEWNRSYPAAQRIFAPGLVGEGVRAALRMLHQHQYPMQPSFAGVVKSGASFLQIFGRGYRNGYRRMYTYVLVPGGLFFCETGRSFSKDMGSKHAMHANAEPRVRCAGEFSVWEWEGMGAHTLVVDNNSGTYAPSRHHVNLLAQVMALNFPDLDVVAASFDDAEALRLWHADTRKT